MSNLQGTTFRLTQQGKVRLESDVWGESPKTRILTALEQVTSGNCDDIAQTSGLSKKRVKRLISGMIKQGLVSAYAKR